jgi:hypothetical protein
MVKVPDNELLAMWKNVDNQIDNSNNEIFANYYLRKTNILELRNANVVSSRKLNDEEFIIMTHKQIKNETLTHIIYSLVIINIDENFPLEKSRIIKHCNISEEFFDIVNTILNHKMNQIVNLLNKAIDEKFETLMNNNFNIFRYRIGKSNIQNILVKPDRAGFDVPSLSSIMNNFVDDNNNFNFNNNSTFNYLDKERTNFYYGNSSNGNSSMTDGPIIHEKKLYENLDIINDKSREHFITTTNINHNTHPTQYINKHEEKNTFEEEKPTVDDKSKASDNIISEMSEVLPDSKIEDLLESISTNIKPQKIRTKSFVF